MSDQKNRRKSRKLWKFLAVIGLFFVFLGGSFWGLVFSPFFKIENVVVSGSNEFGGDTKKIADEKLAKKIFDRIPVNNVVFLPDDAVAAEVLGRFPEIKTVSTQTRLNDHSLTINLELRAPAAIWCRVLAPDEPVAVSSSTDEAIIVPAPRDLPEAENCFYVDGEGFVFKSAPILSGGIVPIVYEKLSRDLNVKDNVLNSKALEFILEIKKQLDVADLNLTDFVISGQTLGDLEIVSPDGWKILLNLSESPAIQINALKRVLEEEIKEKREQLDYVDLRVENRVYYKLKNN